MKLAVLAGPLLLALAFWFVLRGRAKSGNDGNKPAISNHSKKAPTDAGRELRLMMLRMPPQDMGVAPSNDFPRVYGVLMDWPVGDQTATIFCTSTGSASLYTTSTFGIIGGEGHASVRAASAAFVKAAGRIYEEAASTSEYPYPTGDKVRFYLLTFQGVRVIETDMPTVTRGVGPYAELFGLGQSVMTELRLTTEKTK
jgi:hypothetical protein